MTSAEKQLRIIRNSAYSILCGTLHKIEIETVKATREAVARAIQSVVGGTVRHVGTPVAHDPWEVTDDRSRKWRVVADGSLTNVDMAYRAEIVSPILEYDDISQLQRTTGELHPISTIRGVFLKSHISFIPITANDLKWFR